MAKVYKGSLSLEWYNKQKSILLLSESSSKNGVPAPAINWINKDQALFYELVDEEGRGLKPFWVEANDLRVREARPIELQKIYSAISKDKAGTLPGTSQEFELVEVTKDNGDVQNMLIKGDNLLVLNNLKKYFDNKADKEKVKCIFIDPPYNTGSAFQQYDDNLEHSEWLTLMRDRLVILRELLSEDGSIWISIDDKEAHYLKILMDDIFGKEHFVANAIWEKVYSPRMDATEFSVSHDHVLVYCKTKSFIVNKLAASQNEKQFSAFDSNVGKYYRPRTLRKEGSGSLRIDRPNLYYALTAPDGSKVYPIRPDGLEGRWRWEHDTYLENEKKGIVEWIKKDGKWEVIVKQWKEENPVQPPSTYWDLKETQDENTLKDLLWNYLEENSKLDKLLKELAADTHDDTIFRSNEVGHNHEAKEEVKAFNKSDVFATPKPERLLHKILSIATNPDDLVLDCFAGSGTTLAVAHKMKRRWIGVEIGMHAETHIIPRLNAVLTGKDKGGVTKMTDWRGGGSYKYYFLGKSIIKQDEAGGGDLNWDLGKKFIEESLLLSYDYSIESSADIIEKQLFKSDDDLPKIGIQQIGNKKIVAVVSLNEPNGKMSLLTYDEIQSIYKAIKSRFSPEYINIFTNRGVEIAYDSKPDDLEIIKVPHAIFAELEK